MHPGPLVPEFIAILLGMASLGFLTTTAVATIAWFRARDRAVRAEEAFKHVRAGAAPRNEKLEHAVDAIALEVERIAEGQRFVTKLLAESSANSQRPLRSSLSQ